jgi:ribosomal protein S18 acetylase RimI-like enzyme
MVALELNNSFENEAFDKIEKPEGLDFEEIQKLLESNFDIYTEFIPSINELKSFSETTYIIKENNRIAAFAICQTTGNTLELRFLLVLKEHRGSGYGSLLMKHLAVDKDINRFLLWVNIENKIAIKLYNKMGFKEDGLLNCLLANENILENRH